ncbi:MAG: hypothetical protein JWL58_3858 [Streptosporangiaceae bacterium]|nr:hypothetical protein [Streptosporangiaceae bacterium]
MSGLFLMVGQEILVRARQGHAHDEAINDMERALMWVHKAGPSTR